MVITWIQRGKAGTADSKEAEPPDSQPALVVTPSVQDYWHHVEDVAAGFLLGLGFAYLSYRMHYPPLMSSRLGEPLVEDSDVTAGNPFPSLQH